MSNQTASIRNISDTALWAAAFRARETERPDALFLDPCARLLAGARGQQAVDQMPTGDRHAWAWVTRTWLFDTLIRKRLAAGLDLVVNLASGLDARPYRMDLPPDLQWVEVDLPEIQSWKTETLRDHAPRCRLERVALDLSDAPARRALLDRLRQTPGRRLVLSEGLLIYLEADRVAELARDLAGFHHWITDLASPALLKLLRRNVGRPLERVGAPLRFAPPQGPLFFESCGWRVAETHSMLKTAARLRRLSLLLRLAALLPEPRRWDLPRPRSAVCLLEGP